MSAPGGGAGRAERNRRPGGPTPLGQFLSIWAGHVMAAGETMAYQGCGCVHDLHDTREQFEAQPVVRCLCGRVTVGRRCRRCGLVY